MSYRFRADKPFVHNVQRIGERQIERAISILTEQPEGPHAAIHAARKTFKRLRTLYRLSTGDAADFRRAENARIGDMARSLSAIRDATALVEVVAHLADHSASDGERAALRRIGGSLERRRDDIAAGETDLPGRIGTAVGTCREALAALSELELDDGPRKTTRRLELAWTKTLVRARTARDACLSEGSDEVFHDLRKRTQDYVLYLALLRDLWPSAFRAKQTSARMLAETLGHEHDLSVLSVVVNESPPTFGSSEDLAYLLAAIITRRTTLRADALNLADTVFADDPEQEGRIIALLWHNAAH